jgi:hypothetical protein
MDRDLDSTVGHALICVPHPKLPKTLWTFGSIAQVRVPEVPERVVARLVGTSERVDEPNCFSAG